MKEYHWHSDKAGGWRIDEGESCFLIAEGSEYSRNIGLALFVMLAGKMPPGYAMDRFSTGDAELRGSN